MNTVTIPKNLIKNDDLVIIPKKRYEEFLKLQEKFIQKIGEEKDTDLAVKIYKEEKKKGKLKLVNSLVALR